MKYVPIIIIPFIFTAASADAAGGDPPPEKFYTDFRIVDGDTVWTKKMPPVYIFKKKSEKRKYDRLVRNVKKVYPIARQAQARLARMEEELARIPRKSQQKEYLRRAEKELMREYTPVLKQMTFSQGKILIKLIDRQTERTSYDIVRELRGKFTAAVWQGVARLFDANLKEEYDGKGEDRMIEEIIELYESGNL